MRCAKLAIAGAVYLFTSIGTAGAQGACSYIANRAVLTAAQWNYCFQQKQDALGFIPVSKAGDTMLGKLNTVPPSATGAGFSLPPGTTPISPKDGDIWTESGGLYVQIGGSTIGPVGGLPASVAAHYALLGPTSGPGAPSFRALVDGDLPGGVTGSGAVVKASAPTIANASLTAPNIGVATATSINKVAITAPATASTLTIADSQTLTVSTSTSVGKGQYLGTATNDNATAGNIGEYISSSIAAGSAITLTTSIPADITSVSLTAGDWSCAGNVVTTVTGATTQQLLGWVSATSATIPTLPNNGGYFQIGGSVSNTANLAGSISSTRFSLSAPASVYLSVDAFFSAGTVKGYGFIGCRRER